MNNHYLSPTWPAPNHIKAVSTTRQYGFSSKPYDSFNLGLRTSDDTNAVTKNHQLLIDELQLIQSPYWIVQIHGNVCVNLSSYSHSNPYKQSKAISGDWLNTEGIRPTADASYTQEPHVVCAVMTADCVPILLCNTAGNEVAAVHAGWRGLQAGVIENSISQFKSKPEELMAWIGPAIGPDHFEINEEIFSSFIKKNQNLRPAFFQPYPKRHFANLFLLARITLQQCGVQAIYGDDLCTYTHAHLFYSHRRDQGTTGRMASLIWME